MTYVVQFHDASIVNKLAEEIIKEVEWDNDGSTNHVIDWYVMGDAEPYPEDFYDIYHLVLIDGKWTKRLEELMSL